MTSLTILAHALLTAAAPSPEHGTAALVPAPTYVSELAPMMIAAAQEEQVDARTYFRINGGLVTTEKSDGPDEDIDFDEGYLVALALGWRLTSGGDSRFNFDLELEGLWNDQDTDDDGPIQALRDVTVIGGYVNGVLDFRLAQRISLYAGAGIGAAWVDVGTESDAVNDFDEEDGPFLSWQAKLGVDWRLTETMALQTGYRFINIDDVEIDDDIGNAEFDLETQQHVAEVGLSFRF